MKKRILSLFSVLLLLSCVHSLHTRSSGRGRRILGGLVGGTLTGATIGGIAGGSKGAGIGAGIGAAVGLTAEAATTSKDDDDKYYYKENAENTEYSPIKKYPQGGPTQKIHESFSEQLAKAEVEVDDLHEENNRLEKENRRLKMENKKLREKLDRYSKRK